MLVTAVPARAGHPVLLLNSYRDGALEGVAGLDNVVAYALTGDLVWP